MSVYSVADPINFSVGWLAYFILPILLATTLAIGCLHKAKSAGEHPAFIRSTLMFYTWIYFGLNFAFFSFPLPWVDWTGRNTNAILFFISAMGLTLTALFFDPAKQHWYYKAWRKGWY